MTHSSPRTVLAIFVCSFMTIVPWVNATHFTPSPGMSIEDILSMVTLSDVQASPGGTRVAYTLAEADFSENANNTDIWLSEVATRSARRLTNGPKRDETPRWSPNGDRIAFLSNRKEDKNQIWLIPLDGGEAEQLTNQKSGITALEWSPRGDAIAFLAPDPPSDEEEKRKKDKDDAEVIDSNFKLSRLWVIETNTRMAIQLTTDNYHVDSFTWSPDGERIAFSAQPTPKVPDSFNADLYVVPRTGGLAKKIVERDGADSSPRWSPDGKWIAFISNDGKRDWTGNRYLCLTDPEGKSVINLTKSFDEEVVNLVWSLDSSALYFSAAQGVSQPIFRIEAKGGTPAKLTTGDDVYTSLSLSTKSRMFAFIRQSASQLPQVFVADPDVTQLNQVTDLNPQIKSMALGPSEVIKWKSKDGKFSLEGLLVKPLGFSAGKRYPLLLVVHGGPAGVFSNTFSARRGAYPIQVFAAEGYAVFMPNPRGSGAYGEAFRKANIKDWGIGDYQDIMAGVDYVIAQGIADPDRLGIMGWSYGGYMTSWVITQTNRFKAASVGAGVTNAYSFYGQTDIPDFMVAYYGAMPWDDPQEYIRHSAMFHASQIKTPTLIQHGREDRRVPLPQGQELYLALRGLNVPTEFVVYPRQGHGLTEPKLVRDAMKRNLDWFRKWIPAGAK